MNVLSAAVAVVMMMMVAWGYYPLLRFGFAPWTRRLFAAIIVLMVFTLLRQSYWDLVQHYSGDYWQAIRTFFWGQEISTFFNAGVIFSCWLFLTARYELIPDDERDGYRWWNAWMHPCERCRFFTRNKKETDNW